MAEGLSAEGKDIVDTALRQLAEMEPASVLKMLWYKADQEGLMKEKMAFAAAIRQLEEAKCKE